VLAVLASNGMNAPRIYPPTPPPIAPAMELPTVPRLISFDAASRNLTQEKVSFQVGSSGLDIAGQFTAIGCKLPHDLLMQPDIHGGRVIRVASVFQFAGELLASRQAAVETESLH
jgi:hypothetical protein